MADGQSGLQNREGQMQRMTVGKEIEDVLAIWEYAKSLPYVSNIGLTSLQYQSRLSYPQLTTL